MAAKLVGALKRTARSAGRDADEVDVTLVDVGPVIAPGFGATATARGTIVMWESPPLCYVAVVRYRIWLTR